MNLTPMRYKGYTWPHNPETYSVTWQRTIAAGKIPFGGNCMQDLGTAYRVMRGEGTFAGPGAYEEFRKLAAVFYEDGPGLLTHPVWQTASAYFVSLELAEKPLPDYVRYTFEFWESGQTSAKLTAVPAEEVSGGGSASAGASGSSGSGQGAGTAVYIVKKGDTLWGIARAYGVKLADLIAANPQIKNPNLIYPGDRVNIT